MKKAILATLFCCFTVLATIISLFSYVHADPQHGTSSIKSVTIIDEEPLFAPINNTVEVETIEKLDTNLNDDSEPDEDRTHEFKLASFNAFIDKREVDFYTDNRFDFVKVIEAAGCRYSEFENTITISPIGYSKDETFEIVIAYDSEGIINGDTIFVGKSAGENWIKIYSHQSATDFMTEAIIGDKKLLIGFDELDYLWRELRVLTAPADKAEEIDGLILAEIASYYCEAE